MTTLNITRAVEIFKKYVSRPVRLEAECVGSKVADLDREYINRTGNTIQTDGFYTIRESSKWGAELRIYFNCSDEVYEELRNCGFHIESGQPYNPDYVYRINNNRLWWALVDAGLRIGTNS
ncbi:MAG: hypothetical protein D6748_05340 [Calditrichaeota bacterium]|nr:MAG: hypothetical protein D6748_05340 [Calditrichota bacterium]